MNLSDILFEANPIIEMPIFTQEVIKKEQKSFTSKLWEISNECTPSTLTDDHYLYAYHTHKDDF